MTRWGTDALALACILGGAAVSGAVTVAALERGEVEVVHVAHVPAPAPRVVVVDVGEEVRVALERAEREAQRALARLEREKARDLERLLEEELGRVEEELARLDGAVVVR